MAELYIGLGTTAVILYVIYQMYKDDYEDFFKFWVFYVLLIKTEMDDSRYLFSIISFESNEIIQKTFKNENWKK